MELLSQQALTYHTHVDDTTLSTHLQTQAELIGSLVRDDKM